jgi:predicted dehydrogenase
MNDTQPIKTALCSFGMSGWVFHAPFVHAHPGFELTAVWERSKNLSQQSYPQVTVYRTLDEMLADASIELVIVNTPNITHFEYCSKALLAGKHVICEKPFTVTVAEAESLMALAKEHNRIISVYHNRRYDSDYKTIQSVLQQHLLGDVVEAEFHFDRFKDALSPKLHKEIPGQGTGALYDLGSHLIDQALQLFGWPVALFADIVAMRPISQVDDYFEILMYYPNKRVRLKASYQVREALPGYIIHGNKGSFIKAKTDVQETQLQQQLLPTAAGYGIEPLIERGWLHTQINGEIIREQVPSFDGNYMEYYEGIFNSVRHNQPLPVTASEATNVIKIIEAAFKSHESQKVIRL